MELGSYGVIPNYFEQNQAQALDLNLTVLETLVRWVGAEGGGAGRGNELAAAMCWAAPAVSARPRPPCRLLSCTTRLLPPCARRAAPDAKLNEIKVGFGGGGLPVAGCLRAQSRRCTAHACRAAPGRQPAAAHPCCLPGPCSTQALLGKMLFSGAGMEKRVEWLSGGEKARLALAKFMLTQVGAVRGCIAPAWAAAALLAAARY